MMGMATSALGWWQGGDRAQVGVKGLEGLFQPQGFWSSQPSCSACGLKGPVRSLCIPLSLEDNTGQGRAEFMSRACILM